MRWKTILKSFTICVPSTLLLIVLAQELKSRAFNFTSLTQSGLVAHRAVTTTAQTTPAQDTQDQQTIRRRLQKFRR